MGIAALATVYGGVRFRSRLEARVAATLDRIKVEWEYEPEGLELSSGVRYLPDFRLPKTGIWLEVKPNWNHDMKAGLLAEEGESVFLAYPGEHWTPGSHIDILHVNGVIGRDARASAVFVQCPDCDVVQPARIGQLQLPCCGWFLWSSDEFWDSHYGRGYKAPHGGLIEMPQYQDGRMLWRSKK